MRVEAAGQMGPQKGDAVVRFLIDVDQDWRVTYSCLQQPEWSWSSKNLTKLVDPAGRGFPASEAAFHEHGQPADEGLGPPPTGAEIGALYDAIVRDRQPDVARFGHYLFHVLIGRDLWGEMQGVTDDVGATAFEVALCWSATEHDLNRLTWEVMRGERRFLAAGIVRSDGSMKHDVAITRLVRTPTPLHARQLGSPPRVLFVVGTSLTEKAVRPGAELLGVLRQIRGVNRHVTRRVLQRAGLKQLRDTVGSFEPDVVHFVCHGDVGDRGRVYLELRTEDDDEESAKYAEPLLWALSANGGLPPVVVLSACFSGGANGSRVELAGAHKTAPLAMELVEGGIPVVLAMAGRVTDMTCRLFTSQFAQALVQGESLVLAAAQAREATFATGKDPLISVDWALPALFMARDVDPGYAPVRVDDDLWTRIEDWITSYRVRRPPVFCGREELMDAYHGLFQVPGRPKPEHQVLGVYAGGLQSGYGRTRLLQEMTIQALRDAHIPVPFLFESDLDQRPRDMKTFVRQFAEKVSWIRTGVFGLGDALNSQLDLLGSDQEQTELPMDPSILRQWNLYGRITRRAVQMAVQLDLALLRRDVVAKFKSFFSEPSRVLVLLDDVDQYGDLAVDLFDPTEGILGPWGLGTDQDPVPVVFTYRRGTAADDSVKDRVEIARKELGPFNAEDDEDLLVYQYVLLNPFNDDLLKDVSDRPWAFNDEADETARKESVAYFRDWVKGLPVNISQDTLYYAAAVAKNRNVLIDANDDVWLQKVRRV